MRLHHYLQHHLDSAMFSLVLLVSLFACMGIVVSTRVSHRLDRTFAQIWTQKWPLLGIEDELWEAGVDEWKNKSSNSVASIRKLIAFSRESVDEIPFMKVTSDQGLLETGVLSC